MFPWWQFFCAGFALASVVCIIVVLIAICWAYGVVDKYRKF